MKCVLEHNNNNNNNRRAVSTKEGEKFAEDNNLLFLETSARTGHQVDAAFTKTADKIYDNIMRGVYDVTNEVRRRS